MLDTVQGAQDMGMCQASPFFQGSDGSEGSDGCEDNGVKLKVCTSAWEHSPKRVGEDGKEVCLGTRREKEVAMKGKAEAESQRHERVLQTARSSAVQAGWSSRLGWCGVRTR